MKKSEKQEQNQGEVEDEGADRKYQVFNFFLERKYQVFEIGFDAYNVLSLLHLMHPWLIHVPGYILLQFAFLCFIFCKPCQSFRGHVIIKYIILSTGLQKEHFR